MAQSASNSSSHSTASPYQSNDKADTLTNSKMATTDKQTPTHLENKLDNDGLDSNLENDNLENSNDLENNDDLDNEDELLEDSDLDDDTLEDNSSLDHKQSTTKTKKLASLFDPDKPIDSQAIIQTLQQSEQLPVHWVNDFDSLEDCLDVLETCDCIALDTEFIKRNTYYPRLALVQINTGKEIYLIDAPNLDLSQFWIVLEEMPLMIWHACGEDLGIFYLLSDSPVLTNVFDTQIALSYLTGHLQMGYQKALATELDIHISKEQSKSNWLARPLSDEQEQYAIDDVRYLLALYDILRQQLEQKGLLDKVIEDCQLYAKELYEQAYIEDDAIYMTMADYHYDGQQLAVLQAISAWRESLARALNKPRNFILKKQEVRDLVLEMPGSMKQLKYRTHIHRSTIQMYGQEILAVINEAKNLKSDEQPALLPIPYRSKDKTIINAMQELINSYSEQINVPPQIIMRRKWQAQLFEIVAYEQPLSQLPEGLQGWRKQWVIQTLIPLLEGYKELLLMGMRIGEYEGE